MFILGSAYATGAREYWGLTRDTSKAVEWYQKAAEAGDATAMLYLGACYEEGVRRVLMKDTSKAVEWYRKAAKAGISEAAERLQKLGRNHS